MSWVSSTKAVRLIRCIFVPAIKGLAALLRDHQVEDSDKMKKTIEDMELTEVLSSIDEDSRDRLASLHVTLARSISPNLIWSLAKTRSRISVRRMVQTVSKTSRG